MKELLPLPLGTSSFATLRQRGQIYVDKTALIFTIASKTEKFFLSRPRRFGKSLLLSTFESLFNYGLRDFKGLAIEKLWKDETTYQVVRLDFSRVKNFASIEEFKETFDNYLIDLMFRMNMKSPVPTASGGLIAFNNWLEVQSNNSVVLLVDEYDAPLTACLNNPKLFDTVRRRLADFYAAVKSCDRALRFFFITGITKLNKTSIFSELNNLLDITLDSAYGTLLGYTREEVEKYFDGYLRKSSEVLGVERDELLKKLSIQYDGFCFERTAKRHVFAPWSVLKFFAAPYNGLIDYWVESGGNPVALLQYMESDCLREPEKYGKEKSISLSTLSGSSDVEHPSDIRLLTQTGYLTIKAINNGTVFVDYPNGEVRTAMARLYEEQILGGRIAGQIGGGGIASILSNESAESVFHILNKVFKAIDYQNYPVRTEAMLRAIVQVYMAAAGLHPKVEVHNNCGRNDLEVTCGNRHWVFDFKLTEKSNKAEVKLQEAVNQMLVRNYGTETVGRETIRVAIVFSVDDRQFVRWTEVY